MASFNFLSKKHNISFASGSGYEPFENSTRRVQLQLQCPGSILDSCEKVLHTWQCTKCNEPFSRDSENNIYCACGKARIENFTFKCLSENHGPEFLSFPPETVGKFLKEIPELNILVIGIVEEDTATWINSFVNYLTFSTLQEALDGTLVAATPLSFSILDQNDDLQKIKFRDDKTEDGIIQVNLFAVGNSLVRLIDVSGIRGSSEVENMKKCYRELLFYLRNLKELHGICFLPKSDAHFELCFKEFVTYFSYSAVRNIVFCFTGQKSLKSATTRAFLTKILRENKLDISLDKTRMYSMDADCFQFVCAASQGIRLAEDDGNAFSKSWAASIEDSKRLVSHLRSLKPHDLLDTLSVIEAKRSVIYLTFAISNILENTARKLFEINSAILQPNVTELLVQPFEHLGTICTNLKCLKRNVHPFAVCHENCSLDEVQLGIVGVQDVRRCLAMRNGESLYCKACGCFWEEHMQINCVPSSKLEPFISYPLHQLRPCVVPCDDPVLRPSLIQEVSLQPVQLQPVQLQPVQLQPVQLQPVQLQPVQLQPVQLAVAPPVRVSFNYTATNRAPDPPVDPLADFKGKANRLEEEELKLIEISIKIGHYLSKLSFVSYLERMMQYFSSFIKREEQKSSEENGFKLRLVEIRNRYFEEDKFYQKTNAEELDEKDFERLINDLYQLTYYGGQFKQLITGWKAERKSDVNEVFHDLSKNKV